MESSQEASAQALKEMSAKLQQQYDQQLQEQQRKHRKEIEALQVYTCNNTATITHSVFNTHIHTFKYPLYSLTHSNLYSLTFH